MAYTPKHERLVTRRDIRAERLRGFVMILAGWMGWK